MNRAQKVMVLCGCAVLACGVLAEPGQAQQALKRKIDSLFVIASSAEVHSRHLVEPAKDSIAAMGTDAVPILVDKLTTRSNRERWTVIQILKKIGSPAVPYLVRSLKNPDGLIVQRVCWALGDIGDAEATMPLTEVTTHPRWQVREQSLGALGDIGDVMGADAVLFGLKDDVGVVRKAAVVSIGKLAINGAAAQLVHRLGDDFYGARLSAAEALLKLDTSRVVQTVADSLGSANTLVGDLGCWVLGQMGTDEALLYLLAQTKSPDPGRRAHASVAIAKADPLDNCGFRDMIISNESDPDVLLKINSVIYSAQNE